MQQHLYQIKHDQFGVGFSVSWVDLQARKFTKYHRETHVDHKQNDETDAELAC